MSWTILRTIRSGPLFRLCARNDVLRFHSSQHHGTHLPSDLRISKLFESNAPITQTEWSRIRENFLKSPTVKVTNVDQLIVDFCERNGNAFDNAMSFIDFLCANEIPIEQRLQLKVIQLYVKTICEGPVPAELQAKVIEICDDVMKASPALKHSTAVNIFLALSSTIEWKRCIELIENYDIKCAHSTVATFSLLAANAFWADEPSIGWQLLDKIVETDFAPQCIAFVAYWNHCSQHHDDKVERIEKMLEFISANDVLISRNVLNGLQAAVEEVVLRHTEIDFGGTCNSCQQALDDVRLSSFEFQKLKREFEQTSLNKTNLLTHSSQSEFIRFKQHVNKKRNYHYVIDGLNVALMIPNNKLEQAKLLAQIVEYYVRRKKRVLVVGRKHMDCWPEQQLNYIKTHANVFLTANESDDDPYLLYAALVSGEYTDFVTRDQMRTYSQRLSPAGRLLFKQWQKQHQNIPILNENSSIPFRIRRPLRYKHFCHKNGQQQWHVPFVNVPAPKLGRYWEANVQWACFSFKSDEIESHDDQEQPHSDNQK